MAEARAGTVLRGSVGNDTVISTTAGFRFGKMKLTEWQEHNSQKYNNSFKERDRANRIRQESQSVSKNAEATSQFTQVFAYERVYF